MILGCEQRPILAGSAFMFGLGCHRCNVLLAAIRFLLCSRPCFDTASAIEAGVHVIHDYGPAVDVRHAVHIHVHHFAVVEEGAASPLAARETDAAVSEAIVNAAVEADVRSPISTVPAVEAARKSPVAWSPEHAHWPDNPRPGDPIVAAVVIPSPIAGGPEIARTGTDRL